MKRYETYKPSGIEWIGEVPEHWEGKKLKYLVRTVNAKLQHHADFKISLENIESKTGRLVNLENGNDFLGDLREFQQGDVLFNKLRPYLAKAYLAGKSGGCVGELLIFRCGEEIIPKFLFYRVLSADFIKIVDSSTYGSKMPRASWEDFIGQLFIPYPPRYEQIVIAGYLDRKTAQIDDLIAKKQRLIDLLNEEKTAIINHAVTKGLNPDVPVKNSGIPWLGGIPEHWEVRKLSWMISIRSGDSIKSEEISENAEFPVYGGNGIMGYTSKYNRDGVDIIVGRVGAKCGNVHLAKGKKWVSDNALIIDAKLDKQYISRVLEAMNLNRLANQNAQPLITGSMIKDQRVPLATVKKEQTKIVDYIQSKTDEINSAISFIQKEIQLLMEYRTALINEAVTGKIDVRGAH